MAKLITTSLIGSIEWLQKCPKDWKERAFKGLRDMLAREPWEPTPAIKRGLHFENTVNMALQIEDDKFIDTTSNEFQKVCELCGKDSLQQKKTKSFIEVEGDEYCLYGKIDFFKPGLVTDLKTTGDYKGKSHYLSTSQHLIYCYNEGVPNFKYVVAEFMPDNADGTVSMKIRDVYEIDYVAPERAELKKQVLERCTTAIQTLKCDEELWELYNTKFCLF